MYEYSIEEIGTLRFYIGTDVFYFAVESWRTTMMQATERYAAPFEIGNAVRVRREGSAFEVEIANFDRNTVYGWTADRWSVDVPQPTVPKADPYEWDDDDDLERMQDALAGDWSRIEDGSTGCKSCDNDIHGIITHDGKCMCCGIALSYYVVLQTAAPQAYDYAYTVQVGEDDGLRYVAVPNGVQVYQTDRYLSGMYGVDRIGACYNPSDWAVTGDQSSPF